MGMTPTVPNSGGVAVPTGAKPTAAQLDSDSAARLEALNETGLLIGYTQDTQLMLFMVKTGIEQAYQVPPLAANPAQVASLSDTFSKMHDAYQQAGTDMNTVLTTKLPAVWRGAAASNAAQALVAFKADCANAAVATGQAAQALSQWSEILTAAVKEDHDGQEALHRCLVQAGTLSSSDMTGVAQLADAASNALLQRTGAILGLIKLSPDVALKLTACAFVTPSHYLDGLLDPDTAEILGYIGPQGPSMQDGPFGSIVSPAQVQDGALFLKQMSLADRQTFVDMLSNAKSPEQKAYLFQYFANNDASIAQLKAFNAKIQPHGDDLNWLAKNANSNPPYLGDGQPI